MSHTRGKLLGAASRQPKFQDQRLSEKQSAAALKMEINISGGEEEVPPELSDSFKSFSMAIHEMEKAMQPLQDTPRNEILKKFTPLEVAKLDLVCAYSINSLFWMHLITQGINPRGHDIKGELDRIKSYMSKVREIEDRKNAPKLAKDAARRFMRSAMFDVEAKNEQKKEDIAASQQISPATQEVPSKDDHQVVKTEADQDQGSDTAAKGVPSGMKRKRKKSDKSRKQSKKARSKS